MCKRTKSKLFSCDFRMYDKLYQKLNTISVNTTNLWLFFNVISIKTIRLSSEIIILHEDFKHNIPIYSFFA